MNMTTLRREVVAPTLELIGLWSPAAEELMVATAAHESEGLAHLRQIGGPALSFWGLEPRTTRWVVGRVWRDPRFNAVLRHELQFEPVHDEAKRSLRDLWFACAVARWRYWYVPAPLPAADDLDGLAAYWGRHYQTESDPKKIADFKADYRRFVAAA